jgi:hypothetical protein
MYVVCLYVFFFVCVYACMYLRYVCACACVCVCIHYICMYVCMHTHTHTNTLHAYINTHTLSHTQTTSKGQTIWKTCMHGNTHAWKKALIHKEEPDALLALAHTFPQFFRIRIFAKRIFS